MFNLTLLLLIFCFLTGYF